MPYFEVKEGEIEREKMLYTPQDKFNALMDKYPDIKTLKEKFGLDFNY